MLVVTLMSVLELVRMGVASVYQPVGTSTIVVERVASEQEAREALRDYDESLSFGDGKATASEEVDEEGESKEVGGSEETSSVETGEATASEEVEGVGESVETSSVGDGEAAAVAVEEAVLEPSTQGEGAQVTETVGPHSASEATQGASASTLGPPEPGAGASGRSVVSEPPSSGVARDGVVEVVPSPPGEDGALESTEGDGQDGENGEAEALEGP